MGFYTFYNMKELIRHLWENNHDEILNKSLLDCHCKGLHSIMLLESPGKTIRLYIAEENHEMYKNFPQYVRSGNGMTIGFHPHHCDLTLHCIVGSFLNWRVAEAKFGMEIDKYEYHSAIKEGETNFVKLGTTHVYTASETTAPSGTSIFLPANYIHTVACPEGMFCAWLVYEGKEDPNYKSYCYSNADMSKENFNGLYNKPTEEQIELLLKRCNLL